MQRNYKDKSMQDRKKVRDKTPNANKRTTLKTNVLKVPVNMTKPEMRKLLKESDQVYKGNDTHAPPKKNDKKS